MTEPKDQWNDTVPGWVLPLEVEARVRILQDFVQQQAGKQGVSNRTLAEADPLVQQICTALWGGVERSEHPFLLATGGAPFSGKTTLVEHAGLQLSSRHFLPPEESRDLRTFSAALAEPNSVLYQSDNPQMEPPFIGTGRDFLQRQANPETRHFNAAYLNTDMVAAFLLGEEHFTNPYARAAVSDVCRNMVFNVALPHCMLNGLDTLLDSNLSELQTPVAQRIRERLPQIYSGGIHVAWTQIGREAGNPQPEADAQIFIVQNIQSKYPPIDPDYPDHNFTARVRQEIQRQEKAADEQFEVLAPIADITRVTNHGRWMSQQSHKPAQGYGQDASRGGGRGGGR
jgi:hypothetical protein